MSARAQRQQAAKKHALKTRNAHRPRGAKLTMPEVLQHARSGHQRCRAITGKPAGVLRNAKTGAYEFCPCVVEGLIKKHPEVILAADGQAYWPAPEDDDDAQEEPNAEADTDGPEADT